jgi:phosphate starvation-inducible PhoH-like protein
MSDTRTTSGEQLRMTFDDADVFRSVCGRHNEHLTLLERKLGVRIGARGNQVTIAGDRYTAALVENVLRQLYQLSKRGYPLYPNDVERALTILSADRTVDLTAIFMDTVYIPSASRFIAPKSLRQKEYIDAIRSYDIVFGVGPAGTGKTYLAMAMAVSALLNKEVQRIVLARPAVEAGEKLGFLPGDLVEKVNPYLRPLYDALHDMMDFNKARKLVEQGTIEIAPLAFMRGQAVRPGPRDRHPVRCRGHPPDPLRRQRRRAAPPGGEDHQRL